MTIRTVTTSDGLDLACHLTGDGPLLLCHPGGPARAAAYLEDLGGLSASHTLALLDGRGTGGSGTPADRSSYGSAQLADDLDRVRADLGADTVTLLAHSFGGRVVQRFAADHPDRVAALVLVTCVLPLPGREDEVRAESGRIRAVHAEAPWYAEAEEAASALEFAPRYERNRLEALVRPFWYGRWDERAKAHAASADGQVNLRAALAMRDAAQTEDIEELRGKLREVTAPVLVVAGEYDALTPPIFSRDLAALYPNATLTTIPKAGHFPWIDEPAAFSSAVADFLATVGL